MDQASSLRKLVSKKSSEVKGEISSNRTNGDQPSEAPRVIAITSGKGGVGKTNIVGNLAKSFTKRGKKVLILDADLGLANIDIIFGLYPKYNIGHVISGEKELSEVIVETEEGIQIIPAGSGFVNLTALTEGEKLNLLTEFEALDGIADIVLIDTGAGISSNVIYFNTAAEECLVVATGEPTSMTDAYAVMKVMSTEHGVRHFRLIVNMVKTEKDAKAVFSKLSQAAEKFLSSIIIEYLGYVPIDEKLKESVASRATVLDMYPDAPSSKCIDQLAERILNTPRRLANEGTMKFFVKRFIEGKTGGL